MTDHAEPGRVQRMELAIETLVQSVARLENLIKEEITDLKREQIADLRKANDRLAEDQRRAWEAIRELEQTKNRQQGGIGAIHAALMALVGMMSGAIGAVIAKLLH